MRNVLTIFSYIFHPIFIPFAGAVAYFLTTPRAVEDNQQLGSLMPIFILTVIVPILFFIILKQLKLISSIFAPSLQERKYPLLLSMILYLAILYRILPNYQLPELYFYFLGLLLASLTSLLLIYFKVKASIHLVAMANLLLFLIGLSTRFEINITLALSLFTLFTGLVATSRLYLKAHSRSELLIGFFIGSLSQLLLFRFWL